MMASLTWTSLGLWDGRATTLVGRCVDRAPANRPLTMHQAALVITMFGHRSAKGETR